MVLKAEMVMVQTGKGRGQRVIFAVSIGLWVLALITISIRRFLLLGAQAFDLGIFQQGVWLLANGHPPFITIRGWHLFADHFSPILYAFVPFYYLWAHPFWFFLAQSIALAFGALPLFRLTLRHTHNEQLAALTVFAYLFHPAIVTMPFFDFHPVLLSVPFVLWAIDALDEGRPLPFAVACLGALLCREDIALSLACLELYGFLIRRHWWSGTMVLVSLFWFVAAAKAMAWLSGTQRTAYFSLYARWGETPLQILWGILTHPIDALRALVLCKGHFTQPGAYPMLLLAPLAFFPLFAGSFSLFALPVYAVLALSDWRAMRELGFQHAALIAPWLAASVPLALGKWSRLVDESLRRRWQKVLAVTLGLCAGVSFFRFVPHTYRHIHAHVFPSSKQAFAIRQFLTEVIPPEASVSAPSQLVPHLAHRRFVYLFPNPFQQAGYGPSVATFKQLDGRLWVKPLPAPLLHRRMREKRVDYIVLKAGYQNTWPLKPDYYDQMAIGALTCRDYGVVAVWEDVVVLKWGADFKLGLIKLGVSPKVFVSQRAQMKALERAVQQAWKDLRGEKGWKHEEHFGLPSASDGWEGF